MSAEKIRCVLLADRHHGLTEGIRGLLETTFDAVVMVADEPSLQESAARLQPSIAVVDLALTRGDGLGVVRRLRARCPDLKLIVLSLHDEASACRATGGRERVRAQAGHCHQPVARPRSRAVG